VWEAALASALAQSGLADQLAAVSVGAQQHGLVVLDRGGRPMRPAMLWNDTRSANEAASIVSALGGPAETAKIVGSVPSASFTVTKWAWLRRIEPGVAASAAAVMLPHDYLNFCLTGRAVTDRSDASGTGWWSTATETYSEVVLSLPGVDLPVSMLPEVLGPTDGAGTTSEAAARVFGVQAKVLVACGAGDNAAAALALGLHPGEAALSLGTSGTVFALADQPSTDPTGTVAGFASADGRYLPLACTLNATLAVDRVASWLGLGRDQVAPSDGVVFLPWLDGERTPNAPGATGTISGLRHDSPPGAILQAAYEGVVATLLTAADELGRWAPQRQDSPLVLLGGGARGHVWQDTVRRLSGRRLLLSRISEPVAYGAAIQAAAVLSNRPLAEIARDWLGDRGHWLEAVPRDQVILTELSHWRRRVLAP
jgi:xylulokinase